MAINGSLSYVVKLDLKNVSLIRLFCDCESALNTIAFGGRSTNVVVGMIRQKILLITRAGVEIQLIWIPSHAGIDGNERADRLAYRATSSKKEQPEAFKKWIYYALFLRTLLKVINSFEWVFYYFYTLVFLIIILLFLYFLCYCFNK